MNTEFIPSRTWNSYARRLEKANLKREHQSPTAGSIARRASEYIVEVQPDREGMVVIVGWRDAMRGDAPSKPTAMLEITREPVGKSDNVRSAGYDEDERVIQVEFADGSIYEYRDRPASTWAVFQRSRRMFNYSRLRLIICLHLIKA